MSELTKDLIFDFFSQNPERPWHEQDIARKLGVDERSELRSLLGTLTEEGRLIRTRRRTYGLPEEMNLVLGRLQVTSGGNGFVIPDEGGEDLFIPSDRLGGGWDGDKVMARPESSRGDGNRQAGEIVRVLERRHKVVVGTLDFAKGYALLRPDSAKLGARLLLTPESVGDYEAGSRLVARISWPEDSGEGEPFGEVEEHLGDGDDAEIETRAVIIKFGLKDEFEKETLEEATAVPPSVTGEFIEGRLDCRKLTTFTIDGADAKDFDDAISIERLTGKGKSGHVRIGVHIADVSYYVAEGTSLDAEARERATSVYLPGKVLPMLPEELSNGICSLVEGEARLTLAAMIDLDRDGKVLGVKFSEAVVQSDARLTYDEVQEYADGGRMPLGRRKLERDLKLLLNLTQKLRAERFAQGALDFELPEARVDVTPDGELEVTPVHSNQARQLIEELMLLANRLVAAELRKRDLPALFRVHEDPSEDRLDNLVRAIARFGYVLDKENLSSSELQRVLKESHGKPEAHLVSMLVLRSLRQARYSADNLGHFGLGFDNYLHFTSPIRRYPDLVVHRVVRAMLQRRLSPTLKQRMKSDFPGLAEHTSERERTAEEAERDLTRYFHARWASEHVGEVFQASVSGVTNFGLFVMLPNGVEGLMHVSNLDDDYYMYFEDSLMLMGKHTRKKYRFGDRLEVRILNSNPTARQIDLTLAELEMPDADQDGTAKAKKDAGGTKKPARKGTRQPAKQPAAKEAASTQPASKQPAKKEPAKKEPAAKQSGRKQPPAKEAGARQSPAKDSAKKQPAAKQAAPKQAAQQQPARKQDGSAGGGKQETRRKPGPASTRKDTRPPKEAGRAPDSPPKRRKRKLVFG